MPERLATLFLCFWLVPWPVSQPGSGLVRFVMRMEAHRLDGRSGGWPASIARSLPDGAVEVEYLTDGRSTRSTLHGRLRNMTNGTVVLRPGGAGKRYILDSTARTFYVEADEPAGMANEARDVEVKPTGRSDTIGGYRVQEIRLSWLEPGPQPRDGERSSSVSSGIRVEVRNWCASEIRLSGGVVAEMNRAVQTFVPGAARSARGSCAVALRSSVRMSSLEGYEIVSTITTIDRVPASSDLFRVPQGYREVIREERNPLN